MSTILSYGDATDELAKRTGTGKYTVNGKSNGGPELIPDNQLLSLPLPCSPHK